VNQQCVAWIYSSAEGDRLTKTWTASGIAMITVSMIITLCRRTVMKMG